MTAYSQCLITSHRPRATTICLCVLWSQCAVSQNAKLHQRLASQVRFICTVQYHLQCLNGLYRSTTITGPDSAQAE